MKSLAAAALAAFFLACTPTPPDEGSAAATAPPDSDALAEQAHRYLTSGGQIPPDVTIEVTRLAPFEDTGLHRGDLTLSKDGQSQSVPFHVTGDGRWLFLSDPVDLTVDPVQAVLDGISITDADPSIGPADAPVTIVEYSDFQCPFCSRAETIIKEQVLPAYGDHVRFVYKQMPLVSIHPWAQPASEIGICLYRQKGNEAYWTYHEEVFAKQQELPPGGDEANEQLLGFATAAGGDADAVRGCFEGGEATAHVEATLAEAEALGVGSTPTFFVNGRQLSGAQPLEAFSAMIDPELQG